MFSQFARKVPSQVLRKNTVRHMASKYKHKARSDAFFPQLVNYYNAEDQAMFLAVGIYTSLYFLVSYALSGEKKVSEPVSGNVDGIPSIEDPRWASWVCENNGKNMEVYLMNLDK
mmetsp:Transcript_12234/g.18523  ORF Transcript_12234/g.18523 Transcript_12234/m.18523 type:complete len:115 (-) Transcript_12234:155-499(-)|eukprot:CAMPEP_0185037572 /NCGR_PEP_ID=MMETSP1103-20130426/32221_1 /TAXON_ID=36769 /ORGANISM="Paraphysomonas bandaiensis, Strain Caron Lab Isolate" /LENGTH=114 /DNA_ID=CAMNT_0027575617 /DNA_START=96 /DNA_END=440 /DNA_ORIENTATION=+